MSEFRIENGWLVRDVNEHTCGGSDTEWPYAHEPGCGTIPELRLDNLPGWPGTEVERLRAGIEALAASGARGIDLTPTTTRYVSPQWVYDYLATLDSAWRDRVRRLLAGECEEKTDE